MKDRIDPGLLDSLFENIDKYSMPCNVLHLAIHNFFCRTKRGEIVIMADKNWGSMNGMIPGNELIAAKHSSPIIQRSNKMTVCLKLH